LTDVDLYWLPKHAVPVRETLRQIQTLPEANTQWTQLVTVANTRLDFVETMQVDRVLTRLFNETSPAPSITRPVRLAVLSSATIDHLLPGLRVGALRRQISLQTYTPAYGQYRQDLADTNSSLYQFRPNAILFALDARHLLGLVEARSDPAVRRVIDQLEKMWNTAREAFGCQVIQQTALPAVPPTIGSNEHRYQASAHRALDLFNQELRNRAQAQGIDILSVDTLASRYGIRALHDVALWHRAKQEIHPTAAPLYGDHVARLIAAQLGRSAKCLVLDLDNTLWGGVIGDDGLDGIVLGQGSALGEAFLDIQRFAAEQAARGIILAVCSKNDPENALLPFEKHPEMRLKRADLAAFLANWDDKPSNLRRIAETLNIGVDSLVFVDDNPFERNIVRRELPMVAVPELPEDPSLYVSCLADAGYFEALAITGEDLERTSQYRANAEREALRATTTDIGSYLASLKMELRWKRFDRVGLARITQLVNKTNQFNLRTQRYTEAEIAAMIDAPAVFGLQLRLVDSFGDNGIVAILILRNTTTDTVWIDTWLMSCRVLGRNVEEATLNLLAQVARERGCDRLVGEFRPTAKNAMVRDHYRKLGFELLETRTEGPTTWLLPLDRFTPLDTFVNIIED
jgi:FkbH-like protein